MSFLGFHLFSSDFLFSNCLLNGGRSGGIPHFRVELTSVGNYWPITARKRHQERTRKANRENHGLRSGNRSGLDPSEQETRKRARHECFVSHETGLAGGLNVSVSQVETKHLDF